MRIVEARWAALVAVIVFCGVGSLIAARVGGASDAASPSGAQAQAQIFLERRVSTLEQRLSAIESRLMRFEQQLSALQRPAVSTTGRDLAVRLLRSELERLERRILELECGLLRLDERTLSARAREERRSRSEERTGEPCRLNPEAPLRLSTRP